MSYLSHMTVLQTCWMAVTIATIIFLIVAAVSAMPKMKILQTTAIASIFLMASGITAYGSLASSLLPDGIAPAAAAAVASGPVPFALPLAPAPGAPLGNDARAGKVVFSFDDGPGPHTLETIAELNELHLHGVFFLIGNKISSYMPAVSALQANGEVIGNHTWDHPSLTGKGTSAKPLTPAQVRTELAQTSYAITMAGAQQPTLWRPPYGGVDGMNVAVAKSLGMRVVLDSGTNIVDSNDWAGLSAQQIAARVDPQLQDGTIIAFHDGLKTAPAMIAALPLIVAYMNAHHLGATTTVRADATGGCCRFWAKDNSASGATERGI